MHYDEASGGNFSTEAMYDTVDMVDTVSILCLALGYAGHSCERSLSGAYVEVENLPIAGLVMHISQGSHEVALLWQGTRDAAQTTLLESVSPNRIEILSPEQFHVVAS